LGAAYHAKGHLSEAISYYQKAIEIDTHFVHALNNLGGALKDKGQLREAENYLRRALHIQPDYEAAYSNLLLNMHYDDRYSPEAIFSEHIRFANQFEKPLSSQRPPHLNEVNSDRRLRIGYVSPDFRRHSVAYFIEPVLSSHNHDSVEIICYSDVVIPDDVTHRIQGYADTWLSIVGESDKDVAALIQEHKIDILVDLSGHTANNRMLLFARKPAPIQISWIGYPATSGLSAIDYKIVDSYTDPPGMTEHYYTENLIRMPNCFLCYLPDRESPEVGHLPALKSGHVTFGSFNNFAKVNPDMIALWSDILKAVPGSRLLMKAKSLSDRSTREYVTEMFIQKGIPADRFELLGWESSSKGHLEIHNRIDIALDTFPYHGTTTTCEALWMGVPVITLTGKTHASRVSTSLLTNVGLHEFVAASQEEYVGKAVGLANDISHLQSLRNSLRNMISESPLMNAKRFTIQLENCYRYSMRLQYHEIRKRNNVER
jgi:predicted O-linked N-acetylglucosamine transferase (SPINDLY family)